MKSWQTFFGGGSLQGICYDFPCIVDHPVGVNSIVRKKVFDEIGELSEDLLTAEDVELGVKIRENGYKILYLPDAIVWHYRIMDPKKHFYHMVKYGYGRAQLFKKSPKTAKPINFAPTLLVIFLPVFCLLALYNWFFLISPALYFFTVLFMSIIKGDGIKEKITMPLAITLSHIGYGYGFLKGLIISKRTLS
jgi:GT2 family glycosyltransferase